MTWSYSGDPSASDKDAVRFTIQDTDSSDQQMSDEEVNWLLTEYGSVRAAAIAAARTLAAKYARSVDKAVGDLRLSLSQKHAHYQSLVAQLEKSSAIIAIPWAGGISAADKQAYEDDSDRVRPKFGKNLHEYDPSSYDDSDDNE